MWGIFAVRDPAATFARVPVATAVTIAKQSKAIILMAVAAVYEIRRQAGL